MLHLWRNEGDEIVIPSLGVTIKLMELECNSRQVLVGVSAPKDCRILRGELLDTPSGREKERRISKRDRA